MGEDLSFLDRRDRRTVAMAVAAAALVALGIGADRFVAQAEAAEIKTMRENMIAENHALRASMDVLSTRLDTFNTRLSWLEGATSGAVKPEPHK